MNGQAEAALLTVAVLVGISALVGLIRAGRVVREARSFLNNRRDEP